MSTKETLVETLEAATSRLVESTREVNGSKDLFLTGIIMQGGIKNGNGRTYPVKEIASAVKKLQEQIDKGNCPAGELNHPEHLSIDLDRVSHIITEVWMDGDNAMGKLKVLNTPKGEIVQKLVEGGFKPAVSSRGTGNVNEGLVSDFDILTIDVVAIPSAPSAYPQAIRESLEALQQEDAEFLATGTKTTKFSDVVKEDTKAQDLIKSKYLDFIKTLTTKK